MEKQKSPPKENPVDSSTEEFSTEKYENPATHTHNDIKHPKQSFYQENKGLIVVMGLLVALIVIVSAYPLYQVFRDRQQFNTNHPLYDNLSSNYTYNGLRFTKEQGGLWKTEVHVKGRPELFTFWFRYSPKEVEDISTDDGVKNYILGAEQLYLTADPDIGSVPVIGMSNIARIVGPKVGIFNINTTGSLARYDKDFPGTPVKTCEDASNTVRVVWFRLANTTSITNTGRCIIVKGKTNWDIVRASDRVAYEIMGLM